MSDKIYELRPSRGKYTILVVCALFLLAVGTVMATDPLNIDRAHRYFLDGLLLGTVGGIGLITVLKKLSRNEIELIISDKGIEPKKVRIATIPWDHIKHATINSWRMTFYLAIDLREDYKNLYKLRNSRVSGVFKKLGFGDINIPIPFMTLSQSEVNEIIKRYLRNRQNTV